MRKCGGLFLFYGAGRAQKNHKIADTGVEVLMENEKLYAIGKVCQICDVSQRMLRYYEKLGLITPDKIAEPSHYRYYSVYTMLRIQTVRYLIDSGFSLEEIKKIFTDDDMLSFQQMFKEKISETEEKIRYYHQRLDSLKSWCAILVEGQLILRQHQQNFTVKYVPRSSCFIYERSHAPGEADFRAYLETEYFTMSKQNGHSMIDMGGAFLIKYDSLTERIDGTDSGAALLQIIHPNNKSSERVIAYGGFMAVTAYHIGSLQRIRETYTKLLSWAENHRFKLRGDCLERCVIDRYSTSNPENYVTEVIMPVIDENADFELMEKL